VLFSTLTPTSFPGGPPQTPARTSGPTTRTCTQPLGFFTMSDPADEAHSGDEGASPAAPAASAAAARPPPRAAAALSEEGLPPVWLG
jgi:hypothetical protein